MNANTSSYYCRACSVGQCPGKFKWPELVGFIASKAKEIIERENPYVKVQYIWNKDYRIFDCCCNRVWVVVDAESRDKLEEGKVCDIPFVG